MSHSLAPSSRVRQNPCYNDGMNRTFSRDAGGACQPPPGSDCSGLLDSFSPALLRTPARPRNASRTLVRFPKESSAASFRVHSCRFVVSGQNADKTQTKCRQKRECNFVSNSAPATCNFTALKCLHFPPPHNLARNLNLNFNRTLASLFPEFLMVQSHSPATSARLTSRLRAFVVQSPRSKMRKNETSPKTQNTGPLRRNHLRRHRCVSSHFVRSIWCRDSLSLGESNGV